MLGKDWKGIIKYFSLISQVGLQFVLTVVLGVFLGYKMDGWFHTEGIFTILGIVLGVIGGFLGVYKLIVKTEEDS